MASFYFDSSNRKEISIQINRIFVFSASALSKKTFAVEADLINVILQKLCNLIRISETLPLFASTKIQSVSIY